MTLSRHWQAPSALEHFATLVADAGELNLLEAAACIAQDEHPGLDVQAVLAEVDALAERLRRRLPDDAAPSHRLLLLNRYFHDELGFAGNVNDYYAPGNSFIHQVLATRRGIPVALAVIYMELAGQIGLRANGIGFPGHFLVGLHLPKGEVVLDPFTCRSLSREALEEALLPYRGAAAEPPLEFFLQALGPRQLLARMLRNLKEIHRSAADWPRLLAVQQRLVLLLPEEPLELRDRALVLEALQHWSGAAADLERYLSLRPDAADRAEQRQRLQALRARGEPPLH
ncbi:SirB1 family protein [Paucibacter sp. XJ19-41]|uniref:SirB1 family protein n=1 Tax=Paucibacter sp. XJ19-41 TaxID=2927824 RepID=UPI002349B85D|nr:transglutaminase-like domain-containing protein [Paucibacter sp. XJ19-41]MDC6166299.1 transglutaminase-like domain-containing protein [Paucibacter sp. XJ19-41]